MLIVRKQILLRMEYSPYEGERAGVRRQGEQDWLENFKQEPTVETSSAALKNILTLYADNVEIVKRMSSLSTDKTIDNSVMDRLSFKKMSNLKEIQSLGSGLFAEEKTRLEKDLGLNFDKPIQ